MSMNAHEIAANLKSKRENKQSGSKLNAKKVMQTGIAEIGNPDDTTDGALNGSSEVGGSSGGGGMSAEQIRDAYGFEFDKKHAGGSGKGINEDNGAVYHEETGEYIGTIGGYERQQNDDLDTDVIDSIDTGALEKAANKVGKTVNTLNTGSDVAGLASALMDGEKAEGDKAPKPPTQLSHTAAEAEAFTRAFSGFQNSGDLTQSVTGYNPVSGEYGFKNSAGMTPAGRFQENFKMNLKKYLQPGINRSGHPDPAVSDKPNSPKPENATGYGASNVQGVDYRGGSQYQRNK